MQLNVLEFSLVVIQREDIADPNQSRIKNE